MGRGHRSSTLPVSAGKFAAVLGARRGHTISDSVTATRPSPEAWRAARGLAADLRAGDRARPLRVLSENRDIVRDREELQSRPALLMLADEAAADSSHRLLTITTDAHRAFTELLGVDQRALSENRFAELTADYDPWGSAQWDEDSVPEDMPELTDRGLAAARQIMAERLRSDPAAVGHITDQRCRGTLDEDRWLEILPAVAGAFADATARERERERLSVAIERDLPF